MEHRPHFNFCTCDSNMVGLGMEKRLHLSACICDENIKGSGMECSPHFSVCKCDGYIKGSGMEQSPHFSVCICDGNIRDQAWNTVNISVYIKLVYMYNLSTDSSTRGYCDYYYVLLNLFNVDSLNQMFCLLIM